MAPKEVKCLSVRPRHNRTRAGCLTCRSRKKKCDEAKPRCAGCRRNMLVCEWPPTMLHYYPSPEVVGAGPGASSARLTLTGPMRTTPRTPTPVSSPSAVYLAGTERACTLTPQSVTLLGYYLRDTASHFAMTPLQSNPFVSILLPLGYADDLLMHGILALSGAHLSFSKPGDMEIATATRLHYSRLISGLRKEFASLKDNDWEKKERLLRVLMVMCHYEAVSGDTQGTIFNHLRASRSLIQSLLAHKPANEDWSSFNNEALGFVIELYTYLIVTNAITHGAAASRSLPLDFVMSLEDMRSFTTFGALFAGGEKLYCLIPEINRLASYRLAEESAGSARPSAALQASHDDIYDRLTSWEMPPALPRESVNDWTLRQCAAELLRHALHIYLATALAGSIVSDQAVLYTIQGHVRALFTFSPTLADSQYASAMLWPVVVAGACMSRPEEQQALLYGLRADRRSMGHLSLLADILEKLYDDPDPRAYGPYGLSMTMEKHGLSISIA